MILNLPKTDLKARIFERVETVDGQYDIYDIGVEHADGGIDSMVVGGSFYSFKKINASNASTPTESVTAAPAVQGVVMQPVVNYDGAEQDIEGL
jgi:hypothetical protein